MSVWKYAQVFAAYLEITSTRNIVPGQFNFLKFFDFNDFNRSNLRLNFQYFFHIYRYEIPRFVMNSNQKRYFKTKKNV